MKKFLTLFTIGLVLLGSAGCSKDGNTLVEKSNEVKEDASQTDENKQEDTKPSEIEETKKTAPETNDEAGESKAEVLEKNDEYHGLSDTEKEQAVEDKLQEQFNDYEQNVLPTIPEEDKYNPGDKVEVMPDFEVQIPSEPQNNSNTGGTSPFDDIIPPGSLADTGGTIESNGDVPPPNEYDYNTASKESQEATDRVNNALINGQ